MWPRPHHPVLVRNLGRSQSSNGTVRPTSLMEAVMGGKMATHFHIRWITADKSTIDWEAFASRDEAEHKARRLAVPPETFAIEEFDSSCERCAIFHLERNISGRPTPGPGYVS
jgi:hypothetical protein